MISFKVKPKRTFWILNNLLIFKTWKMVLLRVLCMTTILMIMKNIENKLVVLTYNGNKVLDKINDCIGVVKCSRSFCI